MKTKTIFIAALMIFSAVFSSLANSGTESEPGFAVIPVKGSQVYRVVYKGVEQEKVKLNLYDKNANLIFSETIAKGGFILPLNFSNLSAGEYTVELVDAKGKYTQTINHGFAKEAANYIHVSKLLNEDGKYILSVANQKQNSAINVKIYGRDGLIYNETKQLAGDFAQVYAVKVSGELTFEITDGSGNVKTVRF